MWDLELPTEFYVWDLDLPTEFYVWDLDLPTESESQHCRVVKQGLLFIVLIQEDLKVLPFAGDITLVQTLQSQIRVFFQGIAF